MANATLDKLLLEFENYSIADNPFSDPDVGNVHSRLYSAIVSITGGALKPRIQALVENPEYWLGKALQWALSNGEPDVQSNAPSGFGKFSYGDSGNTGPVVFLDSTCAAGFDIENEPGITSLSWPNLTAIDPDDLQHGYLYINGCAALTSVSFPLLTTIGDLNQTMVIVDSPIVTLAVPGVFPAMTQLSFTGLALSAASVNAVLAACVANAAWTGGHIHLEGGTSSAPTGQGIVNAATLVGRGVTVATN